MKNMLLTDEDGFKGLIERLVSESIVIAPVEEDGYFEFKVIEKPMTSLKYGNTRLPPKRFFLPQIETIFKYSPEAGILHEDQKTSNGVLLGVRPCDASALNILDRVLLKPPYLDPFYEARRKSITVISLSCVKPMGECFCNVFETGPLRGKGEDVTLTPLEDCFLAEIRTEKGRRLMEGLRQFFKEADEASLKEYEELSRRVIEGMNMNIRLKGENLRALEKASGDAFIQSMAERCVGCNICSFACPVCYCFDTEDSLEKGLYVRARGWDTCISPSFTMMASGLDPRNTQFEKFCHRFRHKLSWIPRTFNAYGCVGCGRCVSLCPVGIDIREVLRKWG